MNINEYTLVAVKYERNAYLVPLIQLYNIPHQKNVLLLLLLLLKIKIFKATKNKKAGELILYEIDNNIK